MFTAKEISFLRHELGNYSEKIHELLAKDFKPEKKAGYEKRLMVCTTILNKLSALDEKVKKNTPTVTRALVVDDVDSMALVVKAFLGKIGFSKVNTASNGVQAWQMIEKAVSDERPYTFVLSDLEMPKMNGLELLKTVRLDSKTSTTPFYVLTGEQDASSIKAAIEMGVSGYMTKPVNQKILAEKLAEYLPKVEEEPKTKKPS